MTLLVGDIGGTSIRMGVVENPVGSTVPTQVQQYRTRDFDTLDDVVQLYLRDTGLNPTGGVFAVAAPTDGYTTLLTNASWSADVSRLSFPAYLLNDLQASGWAVLSDDFSFESFVPSVSEKKSSESSMVIGLGTGFGSALILPHHALVLPMEYGHVSFAPTSSTEIHLLQQWLIQSADTRVTVEDVLSGRGLWTLTQWVAQYQNVKIPDMWTSQHAMIGKILQDEPEHPVASMVWDLFASILGSVCGDLIVAHRLSRIVLSGGVLQKVLPILTEESRHRLLLNSLRSKTPMAHLVDQSRLDVSTIQWMNLVGVATWYRHNGL
jgi:glucokinase